MNASSRKRFVIVVGGIIVLIGTIFLINGAITSWIEGPNFQEMLDKETSKGLKLHADYGPMKRVGLFGLKADTFTGTNGYKTIVSLQANEITGTFNPLGMILRYWEIDSLHLKSGTVILQKTESTPGASKSAPWPPWWGMLWPYRVYLQDVKVDDAKILWKLNDKESGIYDTKLEITPNWKDFEYEAQDGDFKTPLTPPLKVIHAHLLIRRPRLYCDEFILGDDPAHPEQQLRMSGDAGLQDDRSMKLKIDLAGLKVAPWAPEKYRSNIQGQMNGHFDYASTGTGLETGKGTGNIEIVNGVLRNLEAVRKFVAITGSPDPGDLTLKVCHTDIRWEAGAVSAENLEIECENVFRVTGTIKIASDKSLSGEVQLGVAEPYLRWLPTARSAIFTRQEGAYYFTTVHFSGTSQKPQQDLTARVIHEVGKSPLLALKLFFNELSQ
jgi:hypothetical protein